ncbi:hypothetical protein BDZ94DRAFT_86582 [Collybia nuda]|uniref:Uncharacterized protein n=1 Tax=Collybia nuda TaxID=64659 RepID=A0A9P5YFT9_9AGAR|nr:hypothetical protein BDZ94DRAFT_86582 [Collybia nuda]
MFMGRGYTIFKQTLVVLSLRARFASASIIDDARFIFAFGDSYTSEGFNGKGDPLLPQNAVCSTAGPNWARQFVDMVGHTQLINLAVTNATSDNGLLAGPPADFRSQATTFLDFVTPEQVPWTKSNAIFIIAFGANDVNNSYQRGPGNGTSLYSQDLDSYFATVERLYAVGARQFVFNNVVPFDRAQIGVSLGLAKQFKLRESILEFNRQLSGKAASYCSSKTDIKCSIYDTHTLFTHIMEDYRTLGFATPNDFCVSYAARTGCDVLPADSACLGPVSAYIWKDDFHPSWAADTMWARALVSQLSSSMFL